MERLATALSSADGRTQLRQDPQSISPERALVFELAAPLADFYRAVHSIPGLEFLADDELEIDGDEDFYGVDQSHPEKGPRPLEGRLYLTMPDQRALSQIIGLWKQWASGQRLGRGLTPWEKAFELLKEIRPWGPKDRLLNETIAYWRSCLDRDRDQPVRFEVELWYRDSEAKRRASFDNVVDLVVGAGGQVVHSTAIDDIRYHGLLIDLSPAEIANLMTNEAAPLVRADDVMFLRPQSIASSPVELDIIEGSGEEAPQGGRGRLPLPVADLPPTVALLDGVPIQNHSLLADRLIVEDPDDYEAITPAEKRVHGTSMASLIIHGDRNQPGAALRRRLYVQPVTHYVAAADAERTPPEKLALDVIYQAVLRMKAGVGGEPPSAPTVTIVNLSLGDANRPFAGRMSPWARLIDFLAYRFSLLFVISAGNIKERLPLPEFPNLTAFEAASPADREAAIIRALDRHKATRTLLSPAESLNGLTVGAWHADAFHTAPHTTLLFDPFTGPHFPNMSSALGLGYRRGVKPDILYDGGRELVRAQSVGGHIWVVPAPAAAYAGQKSAAPHPGGDLSYEARSIGSSNAAALITRAAAHCLDILTDDGIVIPPEYQAVCLKTLMVHGASWGDSGTRIEAIIGAAGSYGARRDNLSRFLGYGRPDIDRVTACTAQRVTLLAYGDLPAGMDDVFEIPLPPSLENVREFRRLTVTIAWLTPVNLKHRNYRMAALDVLPFGDKNYSLEVERKNVHQPTHHAVDRGTVSHSMFEGKKAATFVDDGKLKLITRCKAPAGELDDPARYALALSIEVGVTSSIAIYDEVRAAVVTPVAATVTA